MDRSNDPGQRLAPMFDVVATKLSPQYRKGYINRCELLHRLPTIVDRKLTLVHSPPGYGKSCVMGQWLKQLSDQSVATSWLTLEEDEASPHLLLIHILTACIKSGYIDENVRTNLGRVDDKVSESVIRTQFINALADRTDPLVIFLDEYNRVQSSETDHCIRMLLRYLPAHVHVVIASRWRPQFDIEDLRAHGDLLEITSAELKFSEDEAFRLLEHNVDDDEIEDVLSFHRYAEGWPMAIQMLRLWLNSRPQRVNTISHFAASQANLARYLTEQVLSELPEDEQDFLLKTSIADRVNGDLAMMITGNSNSWLMLEKLYERNLFMMPLMQDRQWFVYHAVFKEYLHDVLEKRHPEEIKQLHKRAALWYQRANDTRRAVFHAQQAASPDLLARVLDAAGGWRMMMEGRIEFIQNALATIPEAVIEHYPSLQLAKILGLIKTGHIESAFDVFENVQKHLAPAWNESDQRDLAIIENTLSDYTDDHVTRSEIAQILQLKQRISPQDHLLQALLSDSLASKCFGLRLYKDTSDACATAASHYRILHSLYGEMFIRFKQMQVHLAQGRLREAEALGEQNKQEIQLRLGENAELAAHNRIFIAEIELEKGDVEDAFHHVAVALPVIESTDGWFELYASAYNTAAALAWQENGFDAVSGLLDKAQEIARARKLPRLQVLADCERVFYACAGAHVTRVAGVVANLESQLPGQSPDIHFMHGRIALAVAIYHISGNTTQGLAAFITPYLQAAEETEDTRQVIAFHLMLAIMYYRENQQTQAFDALNSAVQAALFKGFHFVFVKYAYWLIPLINAALKDVTYLSTDKYRSDFLVNIKRAMTLWEKVRLKDEQAITQGELDVLQELVKGHPNKKIALLLDISPDTVKYRLKSLFVKFNVAKRDELARVVRQRGIVELP